MIILEIIVNDITYEVVNDYKEAIDKELLATKITDYFDDFNYIVGDWAYGKLRLKGFYEKSNKNCKDINNIDNLDKYIKENCAFDCAYFVAKRK